MAERRRIITTRTIVLLLAASALMVMILQMLGGLPGVFAINPDAANVSPQPSATEVIFTDISTVSLVTRETTGAVSTTPAEGTFLPQTPADDWANLLLDRSLPILTQTSVPADGLAWWQSQEARGELQLDGNLILLAGQPVSVDVQPRLAILIVDLINPGRLVPLGSAEVQNGGLLLLVESRQPSEMAEQWLISSGSPMLAMKALVTQSVIREVSLLAAYSASNREEARLVLVGAMSKQPTGTPAVSATPESPPTMTKTPTPTLTPSPTRAREPYLGDVIAAKIDPVIELVKEFDPETTMAFINQHPWTGVLTSSEEGIKVGDRPIAVSKAEELNFYALELDDQSISVVRFLRVVYTSEGTTRFPDDLIYFQGHRMEEIVYWMVIRAAQHDGQLIVAYDDLGIRQGLTIIGFVPLNR